jgi:NAD(P)-dependent dehydrogenase (short-subunit alcohol dehydrogenase family)
VSEREGRVETRREPDTPVLERFSLAGKVALVTGASAGLGAGFAVALAQAGAASKAALIGLTRDLNQQWSGRRGLRVNAVAPGYFRSEMTEAIPPGQLQDFIACTSTLGRMGEQHELDAAVVFLASPASSYIAGITLAVDGGMSGH